MGDVAFSIKIPTDSDGYFKMSCPHCHNYFKLCGKEFENSDVINLFCPICGLTEEITAFYTKEIMDKALYIAQNHAEQLIYNMFKDFERKSRNTKGISFKAGKKPQNYEPELYELDDHLVVVGKHCCNSHMKVTELDKWLIPYCSYCGRK